MFIVNPDAYSLPYHRIGPFKTDDITINHYLPRNDFAVSYFNEKFGEGNWHYTYNGREAIKMALKSYNLDKNDLVTILTTSGNLYISSCVTDTINRFCRWNREIVPETKIIFVNHEFGYPYPEMDKLTAMGLPIIEDCCTTFFSQDKNRRIGKYGDFSLYSFAKFFPVQIGGLIVSNHLKKAEKSAELDLIQANYIEDVVSNSLLSLNELLQKKKSNFDYAVAVFEKLGFTLRFPKADNVVPSVLLLKNNGIVKDLSGLKVFLTNHGIQNSVFYGEDAFFIPNHQSLNTTEIDYFGFLISFFIQHEK